MTNDKHYHRMTAKEKALYAKARLALKRPKPEPKIERLDEKTEAALRANREAAQR